MAKKLIIYSALALLLLVAGSICVALAGSYMYAIALVESFDTSEKFEFQTIGEFTNPEAEDLYLFVTRSSGIAFPEGTIVDMYDDGWDTVNCCFTVPASEYAALVASFTAQRSEVRTNEIRFSELSLDNQILPESACRLESSSLSYNVFLCCDDSTNRIWLDYGYTSPFD